MFNKLLEQYVINQYNMKKIEDVVRIFIDLVSTSQMILANKDYYIKITPSYEMKLSGYCSVINSGSKIESFLISDYNSKEKQLEVIEKCVFAYNQLSSVEREFFKRYYYDNQQRDDIQRDMLLYNIAYDHLKKSSTLKFALILGLNKFVNVI